MGVMRLGDMHVMLLNCHWWQWYWRVLRCRGAMNGPNPCTKMNVSFVLLLLLVHSSNTWNTQLGSLNKGFIVVRCMLYYGSFDFQHR